MISPLQECIFLEKILGKLAWQEFYYLKCPECYFVPIDENKFENHATENHPLSYAFFGQNYAEAEYDIEIVKKEPINDEFIVKSSDNEVQDNSFSEDYFEEPSKTENYEEIEKFEEPSMVEVKMVSRVSSGKGKSSNFFFGLVTSENQMCWNFKVFFLL